MKKIITIISFLFYLNFGAQITIGTQIYDNNAVALDINNATQKGLLIPRIILNNNDIKSTTSPIKNPKEGLIIYNESDTKETLTGFYIWIDNSWQLLSSNENKNSDIIIKNSSNTTSSPLTISNDSFQDLDTYINSVEVNTITNSIVANNMYQLPKGNYTIEITLNIESNTGNNVGILGKNIHNSGYIFRIVDTAGNPLTENHSVNYTSSSSNNNKHTVHVKIDVALDQKKDIKIQVYKDQNNSTFSTPLYYSNGIIHIKRGISK